MPMFQGMEWTEKDIVNPDEYDTAREGSRYGMKMWAIVEQVGYSAIIRCIAFARSEQDALDEAVDADKLDHLKVADDEHPPESEEWNNYLCAGNASEFFHQDGLSIREMPVPQFSIEALWDADMKCQCG